MVFKFWKFMMENKVWWIPPAMIIVGFAAFLLLSSIFSTPLINRPFVYDKFW